MLRVLLATTVVCALVACTFADHVNFHPDRYGDHSDFHPDRVHLVDKATFPDAPSNFIFRGNSPNVKDPSTGKISFAYDTVTQRIREVAAAEGNVTLTDFYIIDVNFENKITENQDISLENGFFTSNPDLGLEHVWPMVGDLVPPTKYPESVLKFLARNMPHWQIDKLPRNIDTIHDMLLSARDPKGTRPVVLYVHCEAGVDRTGEFCGSYYMRWQSKSFADALDYDNHVTGRDIEKLSRNGLQWYCNYLKYGLGQDTRTCQ